MTEDDEREARVTSVVAVRPLGYDDELFLEGGHKYRLENPDHISARLKMDHSGSIPSTSSLGNFISP